MKKVKINLKEINILDQAHHHLVNITVNKKKGTLLLDSGASRTMFDTTRFERFKTRQKKAQSPLSPAGIGGQVQTNLTILKSIKLDKLQLKNYLVGVLDLSHVNNMLTSFKQNPIDGVLGADLLRSHGAVIDFRDNTLTLNFDEKKVAAANKKMNADAKKIINI